MGSKVYTAGIVIIGNEILSGRTQDLNLVHMAKKLRRQGIDLMECRIIPDVVKTIGETVVHFHKTYDYVFTTGGIGPTHDDITAESVAKGFGLDVEFNEEAMTILRRRYNEHDLNPGRKNMARMPVGAELIFNPVSQAPGFKIENVHVLAGIPEVMRGMFDHLVPTLIPGSKIHTRTVRCHLPEGDLAEGLKVIQNSYSSVDIGSYPFLKLGSFGVSVVINGRDEDEVDQASEQVELLISSLGDEPQRIEDEKN